MRVIGDFILCKILKENAARLHGNTGAVRERGNAEGPVFAGKKL